MSTVHALNAVDKLLRLLMNNDIEFGGKCILLGGDFRQTLPVVFHGSKTTILENCIKNSISWRKFKSIKLKRNMRAGVNEQEFAAYLLQMGDGCLPTYPEIGSDMIKIPDECVETESIIDAIFPVEDINGSIEVLKKRCIFCPQNENTLILNDEILKRLNGEEKCFLSTNKVECDDVEEAMNFPIEFLQKSFFKLDTKWDATK